jgi:fructose-bisphosphate aldolase class II
MLAPSVGNIHGDYGPDGPHLDFPRLDSIARQLDGRASLVLHGTNDFSPELMRDCIRAGVTKINVNKLLLETWNDYLRDNAKDRSLTQLIDEGIQILQAEVENWMDIVGSSGQA